MRDWYKAIKRFNGRMIYWNLGLNWGSLNLSWDNVTCLNYTCSKIKDTIIWISIFQQLMPYDIWPFFSHCSNFELHLFNRQSVRCQKNSLRGQLNKESLVIKLFKIYSTFIKKYFCIMANKNQFQSHYDQCDLLIRQTWSFYVIM